MPTVRHAAQHPRLPEARGGPSARISSLDGLRALAVLLVVLDHSLDNFQGGGVGVCVFFVLSGFLITSLLLGERERTGVLALRLFYARRLLRLYPALIAMLTVTVALGCSAKMAAVAATYTSNLYNTFSNLSAGPFQHTWSLALEEQFYLLWPLALPLVIRYRTRAAWGLAMTALASAAAAWFGTQAMVGHGGAITSAVFNPVWQAHGLLIGCALALVLRRGVAVGRANGMVLGGTASVLVIAVLASVTVHRNWAAGWNMLAELAAAAMIAGMTRGGALRGAARVFQSRPAVWIGERSYAIYLWHFPLISLGLAHGWSLPVAAAIGNVNALGAATVSHRYVEAPFMRLKDRLHPTSSAIPAVGPALSPARPGPEPLPTEGLAAP